MIEARDSRGHFARGNEPWNKRLDSTQSRITFTCKYCGERKPIEESGVSHNHSYSDREAYGGGLT